MWHETGHRAEVTCIQQSPQPDIFAVGYADGSVRLWSASSGTVNVVFNSHKKAVTVLTFDSTGSRLVSGSQDTDLILWDVVGETGIVRSVSALSSDSLVSSLLQAAGAPRPNHGHPLSRCYILPSPFYFIRKVDLFRLPCDVFERHLPQSLGP